MRAPGLDIIFSQDYAEVEPALKTRNVCFAKVKRMFVLWTLSVYGLLLYRERSSSGSRRSSSSSTSG